MCDEHQSRRSQVLYGQTDGLTRARHGLVFFVIRRCEADTVPGRDHAAAVTDTCLHASMRTNAPVALDFLDTLVLAYFPFVRLSYSDEQRRPIHSPSHSLAHPLTRYTADTLSLASCCSCGRLVADACVSHTPHPMQNTEAAFMYHSLVRCSIKGLR